MRIATILAVALLGTTSLAASEHAQAAIQHYQLNIPRQSLDTALKDLAQQTGLQIGRFSARTDGGALVGPVLGDQTPAQALKTLLHNTGLEYKIVSDTTIAVYNPKDAASARFDSSLRGSEEGAADSPQSALQNASGSPNDANTSKEDGKRASQDFRVAQVDQGKGSSASSVGNQTSTSQTNSNGPLPGLSEIVVTAQKREERLLDVPTGITVISGQQLESLHVQTLSDLAGYVPGLNVNNLGAPGFRVVTLNGISDSANPGTPPLVGTYIDDIQVGSSLASLNGVENAFDLLPSDIEHIEVLYGPQGTLYGSNAMGGIIKYTLRKPDPTQFDASAGGDTQHVEGSGSLDWGVHGAVNIPIIAGKLAMRFSAFDQSTAGWIDNIGTSTKDSNHSEEKGGRASLLWNVTDRLSVEATGLYQQVNSDDWSNVAVSLQTRKLLYGWNVTDTDFPEPVSQQSSLAALHINWDAGFATLTSTSSWSKVLTGVSEELPSFAAYVPPPGALVAYANQDPSTKYTQEIRLASPAAQRIQWLVGGFYTRESSEENSVWKTYTSDRVLLPAEKYSIFVSNPGNLAATFAEKAAFGDVTFKVTDRFDVGGGARYSWDNQHNCSLYGTIGIFATSPQTCTILPAQGVATWLGNTSFHFTPDLMVYGRVATGYRPGSGCPTCTNKFIPQAPPVINPDSIIDYEVGVKGELFDKRLQFTLSVFDIDWTNIQVTTLSPEGEPYASNAGTARSTGFNASAAYEVVKGLRLNATLGYSDARLTIGDRAIGAVSGDRLPVTPLWSASLRADYIRLLSDDMSLTAGGAYRYRDVVVNNFSQSATGLLPLPVQHIVDLYTGLELNKVSLRLYLRNVFNDISYVGLKEVESPTVLKLVPVLPRTLGLSVDYRFR